VFDLWDTLVPFDAGAWHRELERFARDSAIDPGAYMDAWAQDRPARDCGELEDSVRRIHDKLALALDEETIRAIVRERRVAADAQFVPREGALETLERLRACGVKTGLISNCSSEIPSIWMESPFASLVDVCVFSCREGARKPEPGLYEAAASRLGVDPQACVYVGDGNDDELRGAARAGMRPVLLRTELERDWDGEVIETLPEIVELVT
jgi:putative hydrolase of the HAD superfamily